MASLGSFDWVLLERDHVNAGDVVSADAGGMPIYQVLAVEDGKAWVKDDMHPAPHAMPLDRFRWKATPARA